MNAPVLPLPVSATPMMSRPVNAGGIASCEGIGCRLAGPIKARMRQERANRVSGEDWSFYLISLCHITRVADGIASNKQNTYPLNVGWCKPLKRLTSLAQNISKP